MLYYSTTRDANPLLIGADSLHSLAGNKLKINLRQIEQILQPLEHLLTIQYLYTMSQITCMYDISEYYTVSSNNVSLREVIITIR